MNIRRRSLRLAKFVSGNCTPQGAYCAACKMCVWYSHCLAELTKADDLTLIPQLGRSKRDAMQGDLPTMSRPCRRRCQPLHPWQQDNLSRRRPRISLGVSGASAASERPERATLSERLDSASPDAGRTLLRHRGRPHARRLLLARIRRAAEWRQWLGTVRLFFRRRADRRGGATSVRRCMGLHQIIAACGNLLLLEI